MSEEIADVTVMTPDGLGLLIRADSGRAGEFVAVKLHRTGKVDLFPVRDVKPVSRA